MHTSKHYSYSLDHLLVIHYFGSFEVPGLVECQFYLCGAAPEPFETKRCTPWLPVVQERINYVATLFERGERATSTQ